jgi:hypothetical protein
MLRYTCRHDTQIPHYEEMEAPGVNSVKSERALIEGTI